MDPALRPGAFPRLLHDGGEAGMDGKTRAPSCPAGRRHGNGPELRKKAYEAGNLKSTNEQHVIVERRHLGRVGRPSVVYVPVYDPGGFTDMVVALLRPMSLPHPYSAAVYYPATSGSVPASS